MVESLAEGDGKLTTFDGVVLYQGNVGLERRAVRELADFLQDEGRDGGATDAPFVGLGQGDLDRVLDTVFIDFDR